VALGMSNAYADCRWCQGRGCLNCPAERAWNERAARKRERELGEVLGGLQVDPADVRELIAEALAFRERGILQGLDRGILRLIRVTEIVETAEGRHVEFHEDGVQTLAAGARPRPRRAETARPAEHLCRFQGEPPDFNRRVCACGRRQVFRWLPESLTCQGEWIELPPASIPSAPDLRKPPRQRTGRRKVAAK